MTLTPVVVPPKDTAPPGHTAPRRINPLLYKAGIPVLLLIGVYFLPAPAGVAAHGMPMLAIFVATIVALILQPLPTGSVALIGLTLAMITGTQTPGNALSGFSNTTIWLIVASFFIAQGFLVTGLGERVALLFVSRLGRSSLGLSYGMALTDLVLAPATPSNTARAGGVVYPIIVSLSKIEKSEAEPDASRKRLGAYLLLTSLQVNVVTSAMFVTAMAGNPIAVAAAAKLGIDISWARWALAASVPGLASLVAVPWVMSKIYPPTVTSTPEAPRHARERLKDAGPMSRHEKIMGGTFVLLRSGRSLSTVARRCSRVAPMSKRWRTRPISTWARSPNVCRLLLSPSPRSPSRLWPRSLDMLSVAASNWRCAPISGCAARVQSWASRRSFWELFPGPVAPSDCPGSSGPPRAKNLILTGRMVDAEEALRIGLVDEVVPDADVYTAATRLAERFAAGPAHALRAAKHAIDAGLDVGLDTGLEIERLHFSALFATEDQKIGMQSFIDDGPGKARFAGH